jgi:hypothetical protein
MKKNDLFLAGHAYAAVFVTHLAKEMIDRNLDPFSIYNDKWNLKGIMMGNPCVKPDECYATGAYKSSRYHYEYLFKRAFFSKIIFEKYQQACGFNYDGVDCFQQRLKLDSLFNDTNTSAYNIYDKCYKGQNDSLSYLNTGC